MNEQTGRIAITPDGLNRSTYSKKASGIERAYYELVIQALINRRRALNLSQEELDQTLGVSEGQVAKWERFDRLPSAFMFACWAQALSLMLVPVPTK